jgi:hypothetical protein
VNATWIDSNLDDSDDEDWWQRRCTAVAVAILDHGGRAGAVRTLVQAGADVNIGAPLLSLVGLADWNVPSRLHEVLQAPGVDLDVVGYNRSWDEVGLLDLAKDNDEWEITEHVTYMIKNASYFDVPGTACSAHSHTRRHTAEAMSISTWHEDAQTAIIVCPQEMDVRYRWSTLRAAWVGAVVRTGLGAAQLRGRRRPPDGAPCT